MPPENQCQDHSVMHASIEVNGAILSRVEKTLKIFIVKHEALADGIATNKDEIKDALADLKLCIVKKEAARDRRIFSTILKYGGKTLKALVFIIVGLAGGTIIVSDSKTVAEAIGKILFKIF